MLLFEGSNLVLFKTRLGFLLLDRLIFRINDVKGDTRSARENLMYRQTNVTHSHCKFISAKCIYAFIRLLCENMRS
jgi:hypothetical protein